MDMIEPQKNGADFFGFYTSKGDVFSSWGCNVRREEIVMHSNDIISDHQVIMQCRN